MTVGDIFRNAPNVAGDYGQAASLSFEVDQSRRFRPDGRAYQAIGTLHIGLNLLFGAVKYDSRGKAQFLR